MASDKCTGVLRDRLLFLTALFLTGDWSYNCKKEENDDCNLQDKSNYDPENVKV